MNRAFVALLLALFASGTAAAPARALLPAYVDGVLHQPAQLTSIILAIQIACGGLFALAAGAVSDLISRRLAVLIGLTTAFFGGVLFILHDPRLLLAAAALWGIAGGFQAAGGQSFLLASVSHTRIGSASAIYFVANTASGALGAFIAGQLADRIGYQAVALGAAIAGCLALTLATLFLPSLGHDGAPRTKAAPGQDSQASPGPTGALERPVQSYAELLRTPDVLMLGALRFFPTLAWGAASLTLPLLVFRLSGAVATVGLYSTVSLLAAAAAQVLTGHEIDRRASRRQMSPRTMVVPISGGILLCALGAATAAAATTPAQALLGLVVMGTLWGMCAWALSTTMPPLIHELGQGRDDGRLVALMHLLWSAGNLCGTLAAGILVEMNPSAPFLMAAGSLAITVTVGVRFSRRATPALQPL